MKTPERIIRGKAALNTELAKAMTERQWAAEVKEYALGHGWKVAHNRAVQLYSGRWITPMEGDVGFPDWVFCRGGMTVLAELKSNTGPMQEGQQAWLTAGGGYLWRPRDRAEMEQVLL